MYVQKTPINNRLQLAAIIPTTPILKIIANKYASGKKTIASAILAYSCNLIFPMPFRNDVNIAFHVCRIKYVAIKIENINGIWIF